MSPRILLLLGKLYNDAAGRLSEPHRHVEQPAAQRGHLRPTPRWFPGGSQPLHKRQGRQRKDRPKLVGAGTRAGKAPQPRVFLEFLDAVFLVGMTVVASAAILRCAAASGGPETEPPLTMVFIMRVNKESFEFAHVEQIVPNISPSLRFELFASAVRARSTLSTNDNRSRIRDLFGLSARLYSLYFILVQGSINRAG